MAGTRSPFSPWPVRCIAAGLVSTLCCIAGAASAAQAGAPWQPSRNIEFIIPGGAGGGQDRTGRVIMDILGGKGFVKTSMSLVNRPGGGGNIAYTYLNQFTGDAHYLATATPSLLTNNILGLSLINYTHFTPLAVMYGEFIGFAVKADGPFKSGKDVITRMRSAPESVTFAFGTAIGNANHIGIALALRAAGIDPAKMKVVVYKASIDATTALMGGHVDVVATPTSTYLPVIDSGKIRVAAVAAPQRVEGRFSDVPTWREQGVDAVMPSYRMFIGPNGLSPQQVRFWDGALGALSKTAEWKKELDANGWRSEYLNHAASRKYLDERYEEYRKILAELKLARR